MSALLWAAVLVAAPPSFDQAFWRHWGDGLGEVSAYDLVRPRYGELRKGTAVAIFVTETFSQSARVKADPGRHPPRDTFPVMKLNLTEDFSTGIYDYNVMTSAFVAITARLGHTEGTLTKVSFSSQEWCGHTYQQLIAGERAIESTSHSYFDGEADASATLSYPEGGLSEDALWHWARGLHEPVLAPGQRVQRPLLDRLAHARLQHQPLEWRTATLWRSPEVREVQVPAGTFRAYEMQARTGRGVVWSFWVEEAAPHRIIRWEASDGQRADLLGSARLPYWQLNGEGGQAQLEALGLRPRPPRTP